MSSTLYKRKTPLIVFLVPAFIFLLLFLYYPFVQNIINSFSDITGLGAPSAGLNSPWYANYAALFTDPKLRTALFNTIILTICTVVFQVGVALILALLVDSIRVGAQLFRTLYFFPIVISATALGLMFNLIFLYNGGMLNQLLENAGLIAKSIDWKDDGLFFGVLPHFLVTMFTPVMWQYVGFYFVIIVTGLNNIPEDLYEAAALDGCTGLARVRYITLPLLRNVLCTCLVLAITGALKVFDLPWVMFGAGMPQDQGWLTGTYMYDQTFNRGNVDYGSTIAMLIVILGVILSNVANRVFRPSDDL
ncbi:carbohydrate ABC transporter permease [Frisingicoccus sp.]|uniref:carbohydrate ABC transporter permease n=3 Tax=Frisingicoccus sp. TaxID=1918627 RepID=UPI0015C0831A|nr:ABC transporter permease subunit [Frisingicoccus sp.]MEE0752880.1 sugar ABC transporter permease [Frisingicoccus sp.]